MNTTVNKQLQRVNFAINQHRTLIIFYRIFVYDFKVNRTELTTSSVRLEQSMFLQTLFTNYPHHHGDYSYRQTYSETQDKSLFRFKIVQVSCIECCHTDKSRDV